MSSSQQCRWDLEATSADDGGGGGAPLRDKYSINKEANMTNCYEHCKFFFEKFESIHFKVLIAYWMMAGYLGDGVGSVEAAYEKGLDCLFDLVYKEKILQLSDDDRSMIELAGSSTYANCRHPGACFNSLLFQERTRLILRF